MLSYSSILHLDIVTFQIDGVAATLNHSHSLSQQSRKVIDKTWNGTRGR